MTECIATEPLGRCRWAVDRIIESSQLAILMHLIHSPSRLPTTSGLNVREQQDSYGAHGGGFGAWRRVSYRLPLSSSIYLTTAGIAAPLLNKLSRIL